MWIAVAAIVVFCLFPFYWLVNMSLKTGADLVELGALPAQPDARQLPVDLQELDFTRSLLNSAIVALVDDVARR